MRRKRPSGYLRPLMRFTAKVYLPPIVYAKSGTGHRLLTTRKHWESWPR